MDKTAFLARRPSVRAVTLPDGAEAHVRKLTSAEVSRVARDFAKPERAIEGQRYIVCRALVDAAGRSVLDEADAAALAEIDHETIQTLADAIVEFSGLAGKAKAQARDD